MLSIDREDVRLTVRFQELDHAAKRYPALAVSYAEITTRDPSPFKRWLQRRRLADALRVPLPGRAAPAEILDFGAGNGEFVGSLLPRGHARISLYEPTAVLLKEAQRRLRDVDDLSFLQGIDDVPDGTFELIFCLEVFEHLPAREREQAIADIHRLLKPGGQAVIGVPHELFLPALIKGSFRMLRRYGAHDARLGHVLSAALGRPPQQRPVTELAPGLAYHPHHLGFDFRILAQRLERDFRTVETSFSPFPLLGRFLNNEVYFVVSRQ